VFYVEGSDNFSYEWYYLGAFNTREEAEVLVAKKVRETQERNGKNNSMQDTYYIRETLNDLRSTIYYSEAKDAEKCNVVEETPEDRHTQKQKTLMVIDRMIREIEAVVVDNEKVFKPEEQEALIVSLRSTKLIANNTWYMGYPNQLTQSKTHSHKSFQEHDVEQEQQDRITF
jgi:hypothetical protein